MSAADFDADCRGFERVFNVHSMDLFINFFTFGRGCVLAGISLCFGSTLAWIDSCIQQVCRGVYGYLLSLQTMLISMLDVRICDTSIVFWGFA